MKRMIMIVLIGFLSGCATPPTIPQGEVVAPPRGFKELRNRVCDYSGNEWICDEIIIETAMEKGFFFQQKLQNALDEAHDMFQYQNDRDTYGVREYWAMPDQSMYNNSGTIIGDCEDFAILCRKILWNKYGISSKLALVKTKSGGLHVVCVADGHVLDNNSIWVSSWVELTYAWISMSGNEIGDDWHRISAIN